MASVAEVNVPAGVRREMTFGLLNMWRLAGSSQRCRPRYLMDQFCWWFKYFRLALSLIVSCAITG